MAEPGKPAPTPAATASRASGLRRLFRPSFAPVTPLAAGTRVAGRYRIVDLLGQGGMGAVYRAEHVAMRRPVAIKVMRPEFASDPAMADRFEREAQATSRIKSPNVITIHDFGQADDGLLFLVMELLEGQSLADRLEKEISLPWREASRVAAAVARALAAVHEAGVVHRDIKPDNVFLCRDGTVKLLDFGIARIVSDDPTAPAPTKSLTQVGTVLGTALYMSPEAVSHEPIGPPADLYALGTILFEMLTGRLLFEEEHSVLLMGAHLRMPPDRVRDVRPDLGVPETLDELVDRLLAKQPSARPASAVVVADELDAIAAAGPTGPHAAMPVAPAPAPTATPPVVEPTITPATANDTETPVLGPTPHPQRVNARLLAIGGVLGLFAVLGAASARFWLGSAPEEVPTASAAPAAVAPPVTIEPPTPTPETHGETEPTPEADGDIGPAEPDVSIRLRPRRPTPFTVWEGDRELPVAGGVVHLARGAAEHVLTLRTADGRETTVTVDGTRNRTLTVSFPTRRRTTRTTHDEPEEPAGLPTTIGSHDRGGRVIDDF
jgi:hypothetical protein